MTTLWNIVFIGIAVLLIIVIPFGVFFYEAEDPTGRRYVLAVSHCTMNIVSMLPGRCPVQAKLAKLCSTKSAR